MRTTVDIPDALYRQLKARALKENRSIKQLILRGVIGELRTRTGKKGKRVKLPLVPSKQPGSLEIDNDKIYELIALP